MKMTKFTYWQDGDYFLGFLNDYPDYETQGMSKEELAGNLRDLLVDLESGEVPYVRKVEDMVVAEGKDASSSRNRRRWAVSWFGTDEATIGIPTPQRRNHSRCRAIMKFTMGWPTPSSRNLAKNDRPWPRAGPARSVRRGVPSADGSVARWS